jgi:hypothetical protein
MLDSAVLLRRQNAGFISSPAHVPNERLRADLIIDKLSQDFSRFFTIESYRWEHEAMLASKHFQDVIEPPSAFDIVVLILWSAGNGAAGANSAARVPRHRWPRPGDGNRIRILGGT